MVTDFLKISHFILGVEQPYFACPSESVFLNWGVNLGFCSSAVEQLLRKRLLKKVFFSVGYHSGSCITMATGSFLICVNRVKAVFLSNIRLRYWVGSV